MFCHISKQNFTQKNDALRDGLWILWHDGVEIVSKNFQMNDGMRCPGHSNDTFLTLILFYVTHFLILYIHILGFTFLNELLRVRHPTNDSYDAWWDLF
jgi:hypothetical protein